MLSVILTPRRGRIEGMDDIGGGKLIKAYVPLAEDVRLRNRLTFKNTGTW